MKRAMGILSLVPIIVASQPAMAECHLAKGIGVVCSANDYGENAAEAYQLYGTNNAKLDASYTDAVLSESGCGVIHEKGGQKYDIRQIRAGRRATEGGWVGVSFVTVNLKTGVQPLWIASEYLAGACEGPPPPTVGQGVPLEPR